MSNPAEASALAVDALTDVALPGLPATSVDRIESALLAETADDELGGAWLWGERTV